MNYIEFLKQTYVLELEWELDGVSVWKGSYKGYTFLLNFIFPHEGTDWKWVIRADYPETMDRWANCLFEEEFDQADFYGVVDRLNDFILSENRYIN
jgi:hypothetical protein